MKRYFVFTDEGRDGGRGEHSRHEGFGSREGFRAGFGCGFERGGRERGREERSRRHGGGFGGGFGEGRGERFGRGGFGGGRERLFDAGDLKLVILKLLAEQPSYGYQLMKTMEDRLAGGYTPSAGVIYPTLTMLEEEGLASAATSESNKKVYSVTVEGTAYLETNKGRVEALMERVQEAGRGFERGRSPEIKGAFQDMWGAVMARVARGNATPEQVAKIVEAIKGATKAIDEM
jgi:DNA-binding PadR family transcriptional regulator